MATSLLEDQDKYSSILLRITRYAGLFMPLLVIAYGVLAAYDITPRSPIFSTQAFIISSLLFVIVGVAQFVQGYKNIVTLASYMVVYHALGAAYLIWVSGFGSPLVACWLVLAIVSELYFGKKALWNSVAALFATALFAYAALEDLSLQTFVAYMSYALIIAATSFLVSRLRSVQIMEHDDLRRTREKEELHYGQLMTLINSISESIISISSRGTIRVYNSAALNLIDTNQSLAGKSVDDVFNLYDQKGEPVKLTDLLVDVSRLIERDDLSHRFPDGEEIRLSISAAPIKQAFSSQFITNEGYLFIFRDITKSKSLEEERDEFISVISHELRTPITIVEGTLSNAALMLKRDAKPSDFHKIIDDAHEQILFLASMVNDLGTLSRAERGVGDQPEDINVSELLHDLFRQYQPRAAKDGLTLNLDAAAHLGTVHTSRLYLEEILQNFITNAIKYTKKGTVTITATRTKEGVHFTVKDTGIGISKSDLKHVFEKFYRSEDYRTRETSGTGLGLYVVNKLARKLHVHIEVTSRINHGSTFSFTLADMTRKGRSA